MDIAEQLGQVLIAGIDDAAWSERTERFLHGVKPGGVIFFQRNISSAPAFRELVRRVRDSVRPRPFLALDLEGGSVDRLREVVAPLPAASDAARAEMGEALGRAAGRELAAFSLNVDFAPVLDLGAPASRGILGTRTAGATPAEVVVFARSFLRGLRESGIIGCGKHFHGLGSGQTDSHKEMPVITKGGREMEEDLEPFRVLCGELPMIMVAHVFCPALEAAYGSGREAAEPLPATLSRTIVTGLLKERMGYTGLVLSDDLEMGGALHGRSMEEAAMGALRAGCDVLLLCGPQTNTERVFAHLMHQANSDAAFRSLVEQAAAKVLSFKDRFQVSSGDGQPAGPPDFQQLREEITALSSAVNRRVARPAGLAEGSANS